jgi:hypothetical protein
LDHGPASATIAGAIDPPVAIHPAALERRWRKAEIGGDLTTVVERPVEYFLGENSRKVVAEAPEFA